jgi:hypothetical protein
VFTSQRTVETTRPKRNTVVRKRCLESVGFDSTIEVSERCCSGDRALFSTLEFVQICIPFLSLIGDIRNKLGDK